jgi:hypothetical protein
MHPPNHNTTETILGTTYVRDTLLHQEAHNSRVVRRVRAIAKVAFVLMVVGIVAAILVGPGIAIGWVGAYLFPVVAVLGVMFGAFGLLMWGVLKLHEWRHKIY